MMGNEIDEILDEFDFEKVHKVMLALGWEWYDTGDVPSIAELRKEARRLLKKLVNSKQHSISTGGFTAYIHDGLLGLRFEVSSHEIEVEKGIGQ